MGCQVRVEKLSKAYPGGVEALRDVDLIVGDGEVFALMGPNGSGKTTLLQAIAGVTRPSEGSVKVCGFNVWGEGWDRARRLIGFSPQEPPLPRRLTVIEALEVLGGLLGMPPWAARSEGLRILSELGLKGKASSRIGKLSGGEARRVAIALALLPDPEVVVLDEPGSGLDPGAKRRLWEDALGLLKGRTVIFSTHDPIEAEEAAERVAIMHRGRVRVLGKPSELIERYARGLRVRVWTSSLPGYLRPWRAGRGFYEFRVRDEGEARELMSILFDAGVSIERIEVVRPGLREVFFEVTGEELEA
ncbi:MAG: ABC transporter ATP-binding protein [Desulfurococcales archaeon]|nr:ABC transporter ATP-binding protein [Desulfurococcales archaeon]